MLVEGESLIFNTFYMKKPKKSHYCSKRRSFTEKKEFISPVILFVK